MYLYVYMYINNLAVLNHLFFIKSIIILYWCIILRVIITR